MQDSRRRDGYHEKHWRGRRESGGRPVEPERGLRFAAQSAEKAGAGCLPETAAVRRRANGAGSGRKWPHPARLKAA